MCHIISVVKKIRIWTFLTFTLFFFSPLVRKQQISNLVTGRIISSFSIENKGMHERPYKCHAGDYIGVLVSPGERRLPSSREERFPPGGSHERAPKLPDGETHMLVYGACRCLTSSSTNTWGGRGVSRAGKSLLLNHCILWGAAA